MFILRKLDDNEVLNVMWRAYNLAMRGNAQLDESYPAVLAFLLKQESMEEST